MTEADVTERAPRIEFLDGARAIAAGVVAVSHGAEALFPSYYRWQTEWISPGRIGVVLFFMISGYLFASKRTQGTRRSFAARRLTRIFIPYWVVLGAFLVAWPALEQTHWSSAEIGANLFLLQPAFGMGSIVPPAWTLPIELALYAFIFTAIPAGPRWFRTCAYGSVAFTVAISVAAVATNTAAPITIPLLLTIAFGSAHLRLHSAPLGRSLMLGLLLVATAAAGWAQEATQTPDAFQWTKFSYVTSTLLGMLVFIMVWVRGRPVPFASRVGEVSYSLYLTHPLSFLVVKQVESPPGVRFLLYLVLSAALAKGTYELAERPSIIAGRALSARLASPNGDCGAGKRG